MTNLDQENTPSISSIYRYPVKGFSGQKLEKVSVQAEDALPWDRAFAFANGKIDFDPLAPKFLPKTKFLTLARHEKLATIESRFDEEEGTIALFQKGKQLAKGNVTQQIGRQLLDQFVSAYFKDVMLGPAKLLHAEGHAFADDPEKLVSIINLASVRDIERVSHKTIDPLRFRGNLIVDGLEPWEEHSWIDKKIKVGEDVWIQITSRIPRCPAPDVNLETAQRDMNMRRTLSDAFGHMDCGVFGRIISPGELKQGDAVMVS